MATKIEASVKPELLVWARESIGLRPEQAAKKIPVRVERLLSWETGERRPTVSQLRKAASVYKRPLAVFFLPEAPTAPAPLHDFRRLPGEETTSMSPSLLVEMRRARRNRRIALELARSLEVRVEPFSLQARLSDDPDAVAERARSFLGVSLEQQMSWRGKYEPLNHWIAALESRDVLVLHTSKVPLAEMRGFSVSERELPLIVLNGKDHPRGRTFTLMHELSHLFLSYGGVCDPLRHGRAAQSTDSQVEAFCNRVAGAILVPRESLLSDPRVRSATTDRRWADSEIRELAELYSVSQEVLLRRLVLVGKATDGFYEEKRKEYLAAYADQLKVQTGTTARVPLYRLALRNNGRRFTRLVLDAYERERITSSDVVDYLGVSLKHLDDLAEAVRRPASDD